MTSTANAPAHPIVNEVRLIGRLSAPVEERELPSGDTLWTWRLIVDRPAREAGAKVDTIDCVTHSAAIGQRSAAWQAGQALEVSGRLRRRFFRGANGPASRYEVDCLKAKGLR